MKKKRFDEWLIQYFFTGSCVTSSAELWGCSLTVWTSCTRVFEPSNYVMCIFGWSLASVVSILISVVKNIVNLRRAENIKYLAKAAERARDASKGLFTLNVF